MKWFVRLMQEAGDNDGGGGGAPMEEYDAEQQAAADAAMAEVMAERGGSRGAAAEAKISTAEAGKGAEKKAEAADDDDAAKPTDALEKAKQAGAQKREAEDKLLVAQEAERIRKEQAAKGGGSQAADILTMTADQYVENWKATATFSNPDPDTRAAEPRLTYAQMLERHPEYGPMLDSAEDTKRAEFGLKQSTARVEQREQERVASAEADKFYSAMEKLGHEGIRSLDTAALSTWAAQQDAGVQELLNSADPAEVHLALCAFYEQSGLPMPKGVESEADRKQEAKKEAKGKLAERFERKKAAASAPGSQRMPTEFANNEPTDDQLAAEVEKGLKSVPQRGKRPVS